MGVFIISTVRNRYYENKYSDGEAKEFEVAEYNDEFYGVVRKKKIFIRGDMVGLTFNNGKKIALRHSRNDNYSPFNYISRFINLGDSIVKKKHNESILIFRNGEKYYFILGGIIEESNPLING